MEFGHWDFNYFMVSKETFNQLTKTVASANQILLVSHANCGDATGAVTATYLALSRLGKKVTAYLPAPVPKIFRFLPKSEVIISDASKIKLADYDLLFCVDLGEPKLSGLMDKWESRPHELITIDFDHHFTNSGFGTLNVLDKTASATCVMLYQWFTSADFTIDRSIATCLLTGILTDTGSFSNAATNELALRIASELLLRGASSARATQEITQSKTLSELKLWGRALERLQAQDDVGLVTTVITQNDLQEFDVGSEGVEGVANFLSELGDYRAVLVLKEQADGTVKGSLRTTRDDVDVSALAKVFGGGGHKKAAGFTVKGKLVETTNGWKVE